ncbi:hypothetical protein SKAU_G00389430 [Synaphobranchus kaupii]|uniref:Uncharacterized protein n=1 Tax=Synaphobranchus kaupii TaxID=118154 RepID=A0A9Q1EB98_SYNKA|nr:hypothetical protein SKAU_G00389430 [Synaphobranchus kaupii]
MFSKAVSAKTEQGAVMSLNQTLRERSRSRLCEDSTAEQAPANLAARTAKDLFFAPAAFTGRLASDSLPFLLCREQLSRCAEARGHEHRQSAPCLSDSAEGEAEQRGARTSAPNELSRKWYRMVLPRPQHWNQATVRGEPAAANDAPAVLFYRSLPAAKSKTGAPEQKGKERHARGQLNRFQRS